MDSLSTSVTNISNALYKEETVNSNFYSNISITDQNKTLNPEILTTLPEYYAHTLVYIWVAPFLIFIDTVGKIKAVYFICSPASKGQDNCCNFMKLPKTSRTEFGQQMRSG